MPGGWQARDVRSGALPCGRRINQRVLGRVGKWGQSRACEAAMQPCTPLGCSPTGVREQA